MSGPSEQNSHSLNGTAHKKPASRALGLDHLFVRETPLWKRAFDVVGASLGLLVLLPVFAVIALAIKATSRGPVFFRQLRSGRGGRPFVMYKFRTMTVGADARKSELLHLNEQDGPAFKIRNDPRVSRLGRWLRQTSLDELPQLWNVLVGDMSFVGPRPLPCAETDACARWHRRRLHIVPGLTGLWQVKGRSRVTFDEWMRMDLQYAGSQSLWQDLKLLLLTVPAVVLQKGVR
jgi:lipopolysaccharide/colanic/teichoic acid biosynthesis glycosyltransferase